MSLTRAQIASEISTLLADNSSGDISANDVRTTLSDISIAAPNLADDGTPIVWVTAPAASNSTGTAGQVAYDGSYFYVCTATNTWRRTAIDDWA